MPVSGSAMLLRCCLCLLLWLPTAGFGRTFLANPSNYLNLLQQLQAGDILQFQPGVYVSGLPVHNLQGSAVAGIQLLGPKLGDAIFAGRRGHNTVSIVDSAYIRISRLVLDGRGVGGDGVKAEGFARFAHHITLDGLVIINHGAGQGIVGISSKCPSWDWVIRGNRIIAAGTGMYLGNSDGRAPFVRGLIENNLVLNSIGYGIQIKHQQVRPLLPDMPISPSRTIIRNNLISKQTQNRIAEGPRPNLLVGHWPLEGAGKDDWYEIYGNVLYQNPAEALFQAEGNVAFYNNVLYNEFGNAVHIQPHNDIPRNISVFHNTIMAKGNGILLRRGFSLESFRQRIEANAIFAGTPLTGVEAGMNFVATAPAAKAVLRRAFAPFPALDLSPQANELATGTPGKDWMGRFGDAELDFEGRQLGLGYYGAYAAAARWPLSSMWLRTRYH